jgi:uncharacterized NAD(P)/FAD-binding protein YdhS
MVCASYDLAIVGGGLSGALVLSNLIDVLCDELMRPLAGAPFRVVAIEPNGQLGPGIPYGHATTQPGFLMLESVARSTPPEFQDWLRKHAGRVLQALRAEADELVAHWLPLNEHRLLAGEFDDLFVPRRVFGQFVSERVAERLGRARRQNVLELTAIRGTATDIVLDSDASFRVQTSGGVEHRAETLVLAVGCTRRQNAFDIGLNDGYVHAPYADGFESLRRAMLERPRPLDVIVMGSGAAASEVIYFLALSSSLRERLRSVRVVSISGYLAGGAVSAGDDFGATRPWALSRPAAREYVAAANELVCEGRLCATAARVVGARPRGESLVVRARTQQRELLLNADILVNCAGTGRLADTELPLLRNLLRPGHPYTVNDAGVGFGVHTESYELLGASGGFLIGPLSNERSPETHVESVLAVHRVANPVARAVLERMWARRRSGTALELPAQAVPALPDGA